MCTMIVQQETIEGSGKGTAGWFHLRQANVSYDHPFHMPFEYTLNIDFVDESQGPGARVAVELSADSGRALAEMILAVLARAEAGGWMEPSRV
jgi:hypothetical protein